MGKLIANIFTFKVMAGFAVVATIVLCVLAVPQYAQAYTCWYKLYDVSGNLIYAYDSENGVTASAESLDVNTLQQGVKYEFFYDGGDGDPLPSVASMAFDVKIYDGSSGVVPNYGLKDSALMSANLPETTIVDAYEEPDEAAGDGEHGFFIGSVKQSGMLFVKTISPGAQVCFQIGCLPYVRGVGASPKNLASVAAYAVSALPGDEGAQEQDNDNGTQEQGDDGGEEVDQTDTDDQASPAESSDDSSQSKPRQDSDNPVQGAASPSDENTDSGSIDGSSNIKDEADIETGAQSDSDGKERETIAPATAESNDADGNDPGERTDKDGTSDDEIAQKAAPAASAIRHEAADDESDSDAGAAAERAGSFRLADMGAVYVLDDTSADGERKQAAAENQIELTGIPYPYLVFVVLLVLMAPAGFAARTASNRKGVAAVSRLLGV